MENKKNFIINVTYIAIIGVIVYFSITRLFPLLMPFILGLLFAYSAIRLARGVFKNTDKKIRALSLILIYLGIVLLIVVLVNSGISRISTFVENLPTIYKNVIEPSLVSAEKILTEFNKKLPVDIFGEMTDDIDSVLTSFRSTLSSWVSSLAGSATSALSNAPDAFVSFIVMLVSSFYFCLDYENISEWFKTNGPKGLVDVIYEIKYFCEDTLFKIINSYIEIMLLTFAELFIGFLILGISNGILWAILIAILDILPVLGVGTALIPWAIIELIIGNTAMGIGIAILYLAITIIRNIVEPKLVGGNLGLHPLATLITMIVGLRVFGFVGMFGFPLTLSFLIHRNNKKKESA